MRSDRPGRIERALTASKESRRIEFKAELDLRGKRAACEFVKALLAIANSGGGVILVGLRSDGSPSGNSVKEFLATDPATITNLVNAYTGQHYADFEIREHQKKGNRVASIELTGVPVPLIPIRPGTFEERPGKQLSAFSAGVVYVRHGAKSEPATTSDLEAIIERRLRQIRRAWLAGLRKVVAAPSDAMIAVASRAVRLGDDPQASEVRLTDREDAPEFQLVDPDKTHPYRMLKFLKKLNVALGDVDARATAHDIKAIRHVYRLDKELRYTYKPRYGTRKYSDAFILWIVAKAKRDSLFFVKTKSRFRAEKRRGSGSA